MNFLDIVILLPVGYCAWVGFKKGLIIEVFTLLALFVGLYAGIHLSEFAANKLKELFSIESEYISPLAFTLTFLGVGAMVYFGGKALEKVVKIAMLSPLNKAGGVFFAVLKAAYLVSIVLVLFSSFDKNHHFIPFKAKEESLLYYPLQDFSTQTIPGFKDSGLLTRSTDTIETSLSVDQVIRAKKIADSLGIKAETVQELYPIYQEYEVSKKKQ